MILGMSLETFTLVHVVISLVGIVTGLIVLAGMVGDRPLGGWTALFLLTTVLTSVTGFFLPGKFGPPHVIGIISLVVLAIALYGLYGRGLSGAWRPIYVITAVLALYLNVFVGVVQSFQKVAFLQPLAPTQSEPPFLAAQAIVLLLFVILGFLAVRHFRPQRSFA